MARRPFALAVGCLSLAIGLIAPLRPDLWQGMFSRRPAQSEGRWELSYAPRLFAPPEYRLVIRLTSVFPLLIGLIALDMAIFGAWPS